MKMQYEISISYFYQEYLSTTYYMYYIHIYVQVEIWKRYMFAQNKSYYNDTINLEDKLLRYQTFKTGDKDK